jgi:hypothetical protein
VTSPTSEYTAAKGRRFALTIAIAFAVFAGVSAWRGRELPPMILGAAALVFLLGAMIVPSRLEPVEKAWMSLAHAISKITTPIFMGIVYFVVLTPIGLLRRTIGKNPLVHSAENGSYWISKSPADASRARQKMERQF